MDQELERYKRLKNMREDPGSLQKPGATVDRLKELVQDKSGLGTITGVGIVAALALLASKAKDQRLISKAIKSRIPINTSFIKPGLALGAGGIMGVAGKHFYDKYNKEDGYY